MKCFGEMNREVSVSFSMDPHSVCILMNPSLNCAFDNLQEDQNGRIVSVDLSLIGSNLFFFMQYLCPL